MKRGRQISVVLADDHAILRSGLRMLLSQQPDITVVGEAENGDQAIEQVRLKQPDIVLLNLSMPGTGGVEASKEIRKRSPHTRIVVLTMHSESVYIESSLKAGACGYVLKGSLDTELLSAIRAAHQGKTLIDSAIASFLIEKAFNSSTQVVPAYKLLHLLSRRESQVLKLVAAGYTNHQIACQAFISVKSVETYRARLLRKLQITTRHEMVQLAVNAGLLVTAPESPIADSSWFVCCRVFPYKLFAENPDIQAPHLFAYCTLLLSPGHGTLS